jgi:hypothetical protein
MIQTKEEHVYKSGPWVAEFGEYERFMSHEITNKEREILEQSSPQIDVLKCKLKNINSDKLKKEHYLLHRENGKIETWRYEGHGRIESGYCIFTRPCINYEEKINENYLKIKKIH